MPTEQDIRAAMDVFQCDRDTAIQRLAPFETTDEDREYAKFVVDLFEHYRFDYDQFERAFWRDNAALAKCSRPQWSPCQRECIERMMRRYLKRMYKSAT